MRIIILLASTFVMFLVRSTVAAGEKDEPKGMINATIQRAERITVFYPRDNIIDAPPVQTGTVELVRPESRIELARVFANEPLPLDANGSKIYRQQRVLPETLRAEFPRPCVIIIECSETLPLFLEVYAHYTVVNRSILLRQKSGEEFYRAMKTVARNATGLAEK